MARAGLYGAILSLLAVLPVFAATVEVTVIGIRNAHGDVRVALCSKQRFLGTTCEHVGHMPAQPGTVTVRITGVPPGIWAAQAFHDEDRDGKIGRNLLGLPTEGLGFSNDARFRFGPPTFTDAAFQLTEPGGRITVPLHYNF